MEILERFLNYIAIDTTSDSKSATTPSTPNQKILAQKIVEELQQMGVRNIYHDTKYGYIYATIEGNPSLKKIGFLTHLDTSEDAKGENISANIIKNYDGEDIYLNDSVISRVSSYPDLKNHKGKTLITTDGTTLLGADDKAGIAEVMTMVEYFCQNDADHGDIYLCFTPDEEIGRGTDHIDLSRFTPDFAYTIDGSHLGEISYENFNAATATIEISGVSTHAGAGKGIMVNSLLLAIEIDNQLPDELPSNTEGYEGFYHLKEIIGNMEKSKMQYLIRDFDKKHFEYRKNLLDEIVNKLNKKYNNCINIEIKDTYYNMKEIIEKNIDIVDSVKLAMEKVGIKPLIVPIRGGKDGTSLTYQGLPCPNIGTGGHNFHGVNEYVALEDMEKTVEVLIEIAKQNTLINDHKAPQKIKA